MRSTERNFIALAIVAVLAACGGGGGSSPSGVTPQSAASSAPTAGSGTTGTATAAPSSLPEGYAKAAFTITVPTSSGTASRARETVGTGTGSIVFTLLEAAGAPVTGATPQVFPLTATSPGCASGSAGITCTLSVAAPLGLDVYLAQTYTGTNGTGSLTGSGAVQLDVAQNSSNTASLSLTSQVASVYLASSATYLGDPYVNSDNGSSSRSGILATRKTASGTGEISSLRIFVIGLDGSGNTILNPSIYDTPISLQLIFSDIYDNPLYPGVPDVTLSVAYSSSVDPGGCNGSSTTSSSYGAVQVCSPADVVTATLNQVPNGSPNAVVIGSVGASGYFPVPAPSTTPAPFPTSTPPNASYLVFPVTVPSGPTGSLPVTGN